MAAVDVQATARVDFSITGHVARVRFSNPGKRNAFTWTMYEQLRQACHQVNENQNVRVVVFHGDPEDGFAAGTDIRQFTDFRDGQDGIDYEERVGEVLSAVGAIRTPTIAMVHRHAVGAGLAVAAMCDIVVAERGARFGAPIARTLGNCIPITVLNRLRSRVGVGITTYMLLAARLVEAETLLGSGFVARVFDRDQLEPETARLAERISHGAPLTLRALKEMGRRLDEASLPEAVDLLHLCYGSDDFRSGVRGFLEQTRPKWNGR